MPSLEGFLIAPVAEQLVLMGTAVTGTFSTVNGTNINSNEHFQVNYNANDVTLSVESGPEER